MNNTLFMTVEARLAQAVTIAKAPDGTDLILSLINNNESCWLDEKTGSLTKSAEVTGID